MIWAPEYGVDHDSEVCDFIDQYVSCKLPKEDGKLRELVLLLQQHKQRAYNAVLLIPAKFAKSSTRN